MSACEHDWTERGSGPDDRWRECWLCGKTDDLPDSVPTVREAGDEGIAAVLATVASDHRPNVGYEAPHSDLIACSCDGTVYEAPDYRTHVAAAQMTALAPLIAELERAAGERALREAADLIAPYSGIGMGSQPTRSEVSDWLRDRAAALAPETPEADK